MAQSHEDQFRTRLVAAIEAHKAEANREEGGLKGLRAQLADETARTVKWGLWGANICLEQLELTPDVNVTERVDRSQSSCPAWWFDELGVVANPDMAAGRELSLLTVHGRFIRYNPRSRVDVDVENDQIEIYGRLSAVGDETEVLQSETVLRREITHLQRLQGALLDFLAEQAVEGGVGIVLP